MEALTHAVLLSPEAAYKPAQLTFGLEFETVQARESAIEKALEEAKNKELGTRSIFKQFALKPEEIEPDLVETDTVLGNPETVERFIRSAVRFWAARSMPTKKNCFVLYHGRFAPDDPIAASERGSAQDHISFAGSGRPPLHRPQPSVRRTVCQHVMRLAFEASTDIVRLGQP